METLLWEKTKISAEDIGDDWYDCIFSNCNDTDGLGEDHGSIKFDDICDQGERMRFKATFIPLLYSLVFVMGILGNGALLGVLFRSRRGWSVTDIFILHLCVADVLLLFTLPLWASEAVSGWTFGSPLCKLTQALFTVDFYCGIFLLACISLDRYLSIVHATQMYSRRKPYVIQGSCLVVWIASLLLSTPDWIFSKAQWDDRRNITFCVHNYLMYGPQASRVGPMVINLIYHVVGFFLPSAVLIFCYSCILHRLRCGSNGLQKQRASRVIVVVVAAFFVCWTPYNIALMADTLTSKSNHTCDGRSRMERALIITSSLGYFHCSLNPILYAFVGVKFRRQLLDILRSMGFNVKTRVRFPSATSSRKNSMWSESRDTSNSIAV